MNGTKYNPAYEAYKSDQVAWASAEDLILILAKELIRLKDDTGMNLFWDEGEEELLRAYIKSSAVLAQS